MAPRYEGPVILSLGFRPFFIAGGAWAVIAVILWVALLTGAIGPTVPLSPVAWHFNELLFGVIGAALTGFLFTAIPNWTGRLPLRGRPLLALFVLWCVGRIAAISGGLFAPVTVAFADCSFFVVVFALVLREVLYGRNWRNVPVVIAVGLLACGHILFYLEALKILDLGGAAQRLSLGVIACLLALIGGRIVPSFTNNWLKRHGGAEGVSATLALIDKIGMAATIAGVVAWVVSAEHAITGALLLLAGLANFARLAQWRGLNTVGEPLLFVLHVGFGWLAFSLILLGLAIFSDHLTQADAVHALTVGAAGTMILAVMSRAILGHTGREVVADVKLIAAFCLMSLAAISRLLVIFLPDHALALYELSGGAWVGAFLLFLWRLAPIAFRA